MYLIKNLIRLARSVEAILFLYEENAILSSISRFLKSRLIHLKRVLYALIIIKIIILRESIKKSRLVSIDERRRSLELISYKTSY